MSGMIVLGADESTEWLSVLDRSAQYDFYHLPQYQTMTQQSEGGAPHLFAHTEGDYVVAVPLILREVGTVSGLAECGVGHRDATSAYGYMGPVSSHADVPLAIVRNFHAALEQQMRERAVIAVFSRLNPLIPQMHLLEGTGETTVVGQTISMDLTLPPALQYAAYRKNHKHGINKLKRHGVSCLHDGGWAHLSDFLDMYYETMRRVGASDEYFYDPEYFDRLPSLEPYVHLFICHFQDQAICGGLFTLCNGIVEFHLGATRSDFVELSPSKLLFDVVRIWASEQGAHTFHLGGGTGKPMDSLFHFKAGFSDRRHDFAIWRWTPRPDVYGMLCKERARWNAANQLRALSAGFYPAYRCSTAPLHEFTAT